MPKTGGGRTREGPELACVCIPVWHSQGEKGELSSCRGTVQSAWCSTSSKKALTREGRPGCPQGSVVATWYGDDSPHQSLPNSQPCVGGSKGTACEKGQYSGAGRQLTLDKTVGSRVWRHTQGSSELRLNLGWGPGQPGAGVAIDWVTGRSYSATRAGRRLNAQSGLREDQVMV